MTGDQFTNVFMRLHTALKHRAMAILHSDSDSDDALQDAFCRLWTRRDTIVSEEHAAGLSHAAVRSVVIDRLRQHSANPSQEITDSVAATVTDDADDSRAESYGMIDAMLTQTLSPRDCEILRKREMYGYGYDELAEEYNINPDAVRAIVSRGRRAIRAKFISENRKNR